MQMSLLNSRWEGLRERAMERQEKIHQVLMEMQQNQLECLRQWLTKTEDRISRLAALELTHTTIDQRSHELYELEKDIKVKSTKNF